MRKPVRVPRNLLIGGQSDRHPLGLDPNSDPIGPAEPIAELAGDRNVHVLDRGLDARPQARQSDLVPGVHRRALGSTTSIRGPYEKPLFYRYYGYYEYYGGG
jgi:hypothetical protein